MSNEKANAYIGGNSAHARGLDARRKRAEPEWRRGTPARAIAKCNADPRGRVQRLHRRLRLRAGLDQRLPQSLLPLRALLLSADLFVNAICFEAVSGDGLFAMDVSP